MKNFKLLLGVGLASCLSTIASANLITDGTFAMPPAAGAFQTINAGNTFGGSGGTAWLVTSGSVDVIGNYWQGANGTTGSVDLAGNSNGGISQTVTVPAAGLYSLSFYLSANPDGAPPIKTTDVTIGSASQLFNYGPNGNSEGNMKYAYESMTVYLGVGPTTVTFADQSVPGPTPYGAVISDVSLTAVPEPSTIASGILLVLPFGASVSRVLRKKFQA